MRGHLVLLALLVAASPAIAQGGHGPISGGGGGGGVGGSTGANDNAPLCSDGTGGATVKPCGASMIFEGATADANEGTIAIVDPAADWTWTFGADGALTGATQFNLENLRLDGNTVLSTDTNGPLLFDANGTGTVDLGRATAPTALNVFGLYTNASNYLKLMLDAGSNYGSFELAPAGSGSGTNVLYIANKNPGSDSDIQVQTASTSRWVVKGSGHLFAGSDGAYDIGAVGASRPRNLYLSGTAQLGDPGAKPTCDSTQRGRLWADFGGAGVADTVEICLKDAGDSYAWVSLI